MRPPSENGTQIWTRGFVLLTAATAVVFFGFYFVILALPSYAASLGAGAEQIGLLVALPSLTAAATRLATAGLVRRHGARRFLLVGLSLFAVSAAAHAAAPGVGSLMAVRAVQGAGWGWTTSALGTLVADLAPEGRRGEAIGIWGMAPTLAMIGGPLTGAFLIGHGGHARVFLATGALAAVAALLAAPVAEPRARDGSSAPSTGAIPRGALAPASALFLSSLSYGAVLAFLPLELAGEPRRAGAWFGLYAAVILIARPVLGRLSDRAGRLAVIQPSLLAGAAGMALLAAAPAGGALSAGALWGSAVLYGAGIGGGAFPGLLAFTVDRCGRQERAAGLAWYFTAYDLAIACGAALLGPVYASGGFAAACLAAAAGILVSQVVLSLSSRRPVPEAS
ncbi:MAG TPA: MFS transporter [Candidatus Polarisedimenticolia bacterium]|nr:MFS transporter [Candidatus Polarisedimenticolia bacterium]